MAHKGNIPWNKGIPMTEERRLKQVGKHPSAETLIKLRESHLGHKMSEEQKLKQSLSTKGRPGKPQSEESKIKIRIARAKQVMGPMSEETKLKIGASNKGKIKPPVSEETRKKLSVASKGKKLRPKTLAERQVLRELKLGSKSYSWKGGVTPERKLIRSSLDYKVWHAEVFKRDWFTCQISGLHGGYIEAHHIENFSEKPELRFEISNGITLRHDVHKDFHKQYGYTNNTKEQLDEFINNYVSTRNKNCGGPTESIGCEAGIPSSDTGVDTRI